MCVCCMRQWLSRRVEQGLYIYIYIYVYILRPSDLIVHMIATRGTILLIHITNKHTNMTHSLTWAHSDLIVHMTPTPGNTILLLLNSIARPTKTQAYTHSRKQRARHTHAYTHPRDSYAHAKNTKKCAHTSGVPGPLLLVHTHTHTHTHTYA
jgi:hypothetical protein